jgi:undecaprenyl-diphosphatase
MIETGLMLWIHARAHPLLDAAFVFSDRLATLGSSAVLVLAFVVWHLLRRERRAALTWLALGVSVWALQAGLKAVFARARPQLWPHLVTAGGPAMPSGHALASAAFYPPAAAVLARLHPAGARVYWTLGLLLPLYIGFGRLYLGVHWPSDVLVGWLLGATLSAPGVRFTRRGARL